MALEIYLGTTTLNSLGSNLNLTQRATALILPPNDASDSVDTTELKEQFEKGELWVDQAPELKVHICVGVGPGLARPASTFVSQIGEIFCHSKLWLDLGLNVLFKSCDHGDNSTTFQLSFGLRRTTKRPATKASRIPAKLRSTHDAIVPDKIPTARLSTIYISLEFTRCNEQAQRSSVSGGSFTDLLEADIPLERFRNDKTCALIFAGKFQGLEEFFQLPLSSPERRPQLPESPNIDSEKEFHTLFDVGFRNLIADNQCSNKGAKASKSEDPKSLSTISPAVFSLGYREAMGQRSQFIPSIASSIASILEISKNPKLREKRNNLKSSRNPHSQTQPDPSTAGDTSTVRTALKQSLWRIAQKRLYKPGASKNLSPLECASSSDKRYPTPEYTTLLDDEDEDTDSNDSDYYLGTDIDELEFESLEESQEQNTKDEEESILSITEEYTNLSIDMLGSTIDENEKMDFDEPKLEDIQRVDQHAGFYVPPPAFGGYSNQAVQSDSEMLTSDCVEEDMDLTRQSSLPTAASTDLNKIAAEDFDDMLC